MMTVSAENMLVTSIGTTLETGVVPTQYIVIISTVRRQSQVGIQRCIDFSPIVNFCLEKNIFPRCGLSATHLGFLYKEVQDLPSASFFNRGKFI